MLDIGWSELLLIAVVAIVVIGPKDLPDALRAVGRTVTKLRRMAGEFQGQFNEALREADLQDVRKDLESIRSSTSALKGALNPMSMVRNELRDTMTGLGSIPAAIEAKPGAATLPVSTPPADPPPVVEPTEPLPSAFAPSAALRGR